MVLKYKNTDIKIRQVLRSAGTHYIFVKEYSDARVKIKGIQEHLSKNRLVCKWSGGKDSTVMAELMFRRGDNPLLVLCDIGYEFDKTYDFIKKTAKKWIEKYNATIVILDTQYFFIDRIFTAKTKGRAKGKIRGFPMTLGMDFCTRDGKVETTSIFLRENITDFKIDIAIGYALGEDRKIDETDKFKYKYVLKEQLLTERRVLELTKELDLYNDYYDFYFRGGCSGCPKQHIDTLKKTYDLFPCHFSRWEQIESELFKLHNKDDIYNPYMFSRFDIDGNMSVSMTSIDLKKYFRENVSFDLGEIASELPCQCSI